MLRKRIAFFCGLMAAAVLALLPNSARAQCSTGWDASGDHVVIQRGTYPFNITLEQKGRVITGMADAIVERGDGGVKRIAGTVDGTIDGDSFRMQIFWNNQQTLGVFLTGVYIATVLPSGRLDGEGYEKNTPNVRPTWYSRGVLKCAPVAQPTAPRPKPIKRTGRMPAAQPAAQPAAPPLAPPFIIASPPINIPQAFASSVYLGWDGGPDYPNADVWVSINNAPEISAALLYGDAFKQPKIGGFELKLPGGFYKFFLKAAGTTLATVTVAVQ